MKSVQYSTHTVSTTEAKPITFTIWSENNSKKGFKLLLIKSRKTFIDTMRIKVILSALAEIMPSQQIWTEW